MTIDEVEGALRTVTVKGSRMTWDEKLPGADGVWEDDDPQHLAVIVWTDILSAGEAERLLRAMRP